MRDWRAADSGDQGLSAQHWPQLSDALKEPPNRPRLTGSKVKNRRLKESACAIVSVRENSRGSDVSGDVATEAGRSARCRRRRFSETNLRFRRRV
jgi:hypothetical protein